MINYDLFYRKFGVRRTENLVRPPLPALEALELPRSSILHYCSDSEVQAGPASDEYVFRNINRPIMMGHVSEVGDSKGNPRRLSIVADGIIRAYHIKNRRYRLMRSLEAASRDPSIVVVYNYSVIPQLYHYSRSFYTEYYKWWNQQAAIWKNVSSIAAASPRQNYYFCTLPKILPSVADLNLGVNPISQRTLKIFDSHESLQILELWKWVGPERKDSVFNLLTPKAVQLTNLIFLESGRWFVVNLGVLDSWRQATLQELETNPEGNRKGMLAGKLQRFFLRMLMSLFEVRTVAGTAEALPQKNTTDGQSQTTLDATKPVVVKQNATIPVVDPETGATVPGAEVQELPQDNMLEDDPGDDLPAEKPEEIQFDAELESQVDADLNKLEDISRSATPEEKEQARPVEEVQEAQTLEDGVMQVCDRLSDQGILSAAEYRRYQQLAKTYHSLPAPEGKGNLAEFIQIPSEELKITESPRIKDIPGVVDKTMLASSLHAFDQRYIKKVMQKDVAAMVMNVQRAGIAVTAFERERVEDVLGSYDSFTIRATPVEGASSVLRFKLPVLEDDGTYQANGVKYRMRKQRGDLPIRKIAPDRVALTSYYGKVFVSRSSKRVNDYGTWLRNNVMAMGLDPESTVITDMHPGTVFDNEFDCPKLYSIFAMGFRGFTVTAGKAKFILNFDHSKRKELYGEDAIKTYEKDEAVIIGKSAQGEQLLVVDKNNTLYVGWNDQLVDAGPIEAFLQLEAEKAPVEFVELKVLRQNIPVGVILGYELGFERLMGKLGVTPRRVPAGSRVNLEPHEYSLVFADETLVFSRDDQMAALVMAGFNEYHREIRKYSVFEFDKRAVYLNLLESSGASTRHLREIDLLYQMFVDPITRDLLVEMKEPTDFRGILIRSCELLLNDQHPDELDPAFMRIKGYERMAGAVYSELVKSLRTHNARAGKSKLAIDLNPYAVWKNISQDPSISLVSDINPIQNLKEMEAVTTGGTGGRSSRSMTSHTRAYHRNDMGTISEATVDSSDVAINTYTSADPQFTSLRGMSKRFDLEKTGATALLSTSALVSPGADRDDPKRVNFTSVQHSHGVACRGYTQLPVRTGYEQVIPHRTSDLFALTAKKAGKVISVSETGIVVEYADGERKGYDLGRRYGAAAGLTIPHEVITELKEGQKFSEGDAICYNPGFFEKDILNPKNLIWKAGMMVKTVLWESALTLEDSSAISPRVAELLTTKMTKVRTIVVRFDQSVRKLVKVGDVLQSEDILCIIEDAVTANSGLFDEQSLDTLRILGQMAPTAKSKGTVERIEVFYHGEKDEMSDSLKQLSTASDRSLSQRNKSAGRSGFTGSVDEGFRVEGDPLTLDTVAIRIYITADVPAGVGDKGVFCNQLKTVFGEVLAGEIKSESGKQIDAVFGQKSIADRIVLSPDVIGTTATLLDVIGKKAFEIYNS